MQVLLSFILRNSPMFGIGFFELLILAVCGLGCIGIPIIIVVVLFATKKNKNSNED